MGSNSSAQTQRQLAMQRAMAAAKKVGTNYGTKAALDYLGGQGLASTEAANVAWNTPAMEAAQEAWNAAAMSGQVPLESSMGAAPAALPAAAAVAAALGTRWGLRTLQGKGKNWKDASLADNAGRVAAAMGTMGLSEIGNYAFNKFLKHKSTKERQSDRWQDLVSSGQAPAWAAGLEENAAIPGNLGINQDMGVDDKKLASGTMTGRDLWATSGMFETFGKDWANMFDEGKREAITNQIYKEGLFDTNKGRTYVTDPDRARQIAQEIGGVSGGDKVSLNWNGPQDVKDTSLIDSLVAGVQADAASAATSNGDEVSKVLAMFGRGRKKT